MANVEFGTGKSVFILTIVAACFAILWPKIFYPMIAGTPTAKRPVDVSGGHIRQERLIRPDVGLHPALRERGRAIPASHIVPKVNVEKEPGIKPPLPGMRPPMGGAGHVVAAPKTGGTMSIVMPLYTIGIVIFFMYTIMKVFVRKSNVEEKLGEFEGNPEFRRVVFADEPAETESSPVPSSLPLIKAPDKDATRLGWKERDTRDAEIEELRRRLEETERAMARVVAHMQIQHHQTVEEQQTKLEPQEEPQEQVQLGEVVESSSVHVVGVETRARAEGGEAWRPPPSPTLGLTHSRPSTPLPPSPPPTPHSIFLQGSLPYHSQLLVEDAATELAKDPSVVVTGKMTLSLINVPETQAKKADDVDPDGELEVEVEEGTHYTTANTAVNASGANAENTPSDRVDDADDTAADLSNHDLLDDQEELEEEFDAIWGAVDLEEDQQQPPLP